MRGRSKAEQKSDATVGNGSANGTGDVSVISGDMRITGACETTGQLRIEGTVAGDVSAHGVELAPSGQVDGDLLSRGTAPDARPFIIAGTVSGAVRAGRVEVRKGGSVSGGVVADEAVVQGRVRGGVQARTRLALDDSAEVEGDVLARRLALREGGRVNGTIRMGDDLPIDGHSSPAPPASKS